MRRKGWMLVLVVMVCGLVGLSGCAGKGKQVEKKEKVAVSVEASTVSPQEMKTYVSKAGFSVTYPAKWYLEENKGAGWRIGPEGPAFDISNSDPNNFYAVPEAKRIEVFFGDFANDPKNSPANIKEKLNYFVKNYGMRTIEKTEYFEQKDNMFCLAYGIPGGYSDKYNVLFFYLPKTKKIAYAIIYSSGEYSVRQLIKMVLIKTER